MTAELQVHILSPTAKAIQYIQLPATNTVKYVLPYWSVVSSLTYYPFHGYQEDIPP